MQARLFQLLLVVITSLMMVATASAKSFQLHGVTVELADVTAAVDVYYRSMRFNRAAGTWNVEMLLSNKSSQVFSGPLIYYVAGFANTSGPLQPDGLDGAQPFYDLSATVADGALDPGELSQPFTLSLGVTSGSPGLTNRIYARGPPAPGAALAVTRTLNETGQLLPSVSITELGPLGQTNLQSDPIFGVVTLGQTAGHHVWRFSAPDHLPVWRTQNLTTGAVQIVAHPRLTRRSTNVVSLTPLAGGVLGNTDNTVQVQFAPGTVVSSTTATLTPLTGQTLPALLPLGWSPLQSFWLEISPAPLAPAIAVFNFSSPITPADAVALVRWDEVNLQWNTVQVLTGTGNSVTSSVPASGAYALVVGDALPTTPPAPQPGQTLLAASATLPNSTNLLASGTVNPATSAASRTPELVTAQAELLLTHTAGALPSGVMLHCDVTDSYQLNDRTRRFPPRYDNLIVGYQRPGDTNPATLHAQFPLRPLLLFGPDELTEATVHVDVLAPGAFTGSVLEPDGGQVAREGLRILSGLGDFAKPHAAQLRRLSPTNFLELVDTNYTVLDAFELAVDGLNAGRNLRVQLAGAPTNALFVLGRVRMENGLYGIEPRERLISDARGNLTTLEPQSGDRLPGLASAGQYVLLQARDRQALVAGLARNAGGQPTAGLAIRSFPWLTFSAGNGAYQLLSPTGTVIVTTLDLTSGDSGQASVIVTNVQTTATADLTTVAIGPRVVSVTPTNGATSVLRVTPVIVRFNKPINTATALNGLQLLGVSNQPVAATLTFNLAGTEATLLPINTLAASAAHTILLSTNITDTTGRRLEGASQFAFTTETDALNRVAAQVVSYEPTNGLARMTGTVGIAEPESPVILVNETRGTTATVLSGVDGSFDNFIEADVDDTLSAQVVNRNGSRNVIPVTRQIFRDGSVGLFDAGGKVSADVEGRTVDLQVEAGAVGGRTIVKVEPISSAVVQDLARVFPPSEGKFVTPGIMLSLAGDRLKGSVELEFPITRAELEAGGLRPGDDPTNSVFALVAVVPTGGTLGYVIIDKMSYEEGKLVTHSPPYPEIESSFHAVRERNLQVQQFIRENGEEIGDLIELTQEAKDIVRAIAAGRGAGVVAGGTVGVSYFAGALANTLALLPLQMANNSVPLTLQGQVLEVEFERKPDGGLNNTQSRPLGGAMVRATDIGSGSFLDGRPGRIQPGALFAISRANGEYTILRAGARGVFEDLDFVLSATHPRYYGVTAREMANARTFGLLSQTDLVFFREVGDSFAPPSLAVSHSPTAPAPDDTVEVEIIATAAASSKPTLPEVEVSIGRLVAIAGSPEPRLAEVSLTFLQREDISQQSRRLLYRVRSSVKGEVILRVAGYVPFGDRALTEYSVRFGSPIIRPDEPPPPDLVDIRGPRVVRHEPAQDTRSWPVDGVIRLEFNEAMSRSLLNRPTLIRLVPEAGEPAITLSENGRELFLAYPALKPGEPYRLIVPASVGIDASPNSNLLDQYPETPARESFELRFQTAPQQSGLLAGIEQAGGAVVCGAYAYVLERQGPLDGAVVAYDLSNPAAPQKAGELSVPGFPRDLVLIRNYSFQVRPNEKPRTADLLAVAGGKVGKTFTPQGEDLGGFQYLWIIDLSEPGQPRRLASTVLSTTGSASVNRLKWSPPYLTALIADADFMQLDLIKLQAFIFGLNLTDAEFATMPFSFTGGTDDNGDGDYVDFAQGDQLPLPGRRPGDYAGREFVFAPDSALQARWADHDWDSRSGTLGVVTFEGKDSTGNPISGAYQTVFRGGQPLDPVATTFVFQGDRPRRVTLVSGVPISTPQGLRIGEVALVTLMSPQGQGWLATLDITEPLSPRLVARNSVPLGLGLPQSVQYLADGRLALATSTHLLLLDPARVAEATPDGSTWPALLGALPNFGAPGRTFGLDPSGLAANAAGGGAISGLSAPQLFFVRQTGSDAPLSPVALREMARTEPGSAGDFLKTLETVGHLSPARLHAVPSVVESGVFPPQRASQYQVLVYAPGFAGQTIPLMLETLNTAGYPVADKGSGFPPVRALTPETLALIGGKPNCSYPIRPLEAHRVSDNPASSLYNVYLSVPFVLLYESLRLDELEAIRTAAEPREAYWSGAALRVGFDHTLPAGNVLIPYAATLELRSLRAGVTATARSFSADYLMGPNPPPVTDGAVIPGTFGSVLAHNGEFRLDATDFVLPAPRLPIHFERVSGSQDLYDGPFGRGWDFFYNQRLVELAGQLMAPGSGIPLVVRPGTRSEIGRRRDLLLHTGRGRTLLYRYAGDTSPPEIAADQLFQGLGWDQSAIDFYLPPEGVFDFIVRFRDGRFARLEPDGTQIWYNPGGQLEELRDRYPNNRLFLEYDETGALVRISDRSSVSPRFLQLGYYRLDGRGSTSFPNERTTVPAESGKVCQLRDYTGRELRYYYTACGELDRREGPEVTFAHEGGFSGKPITSYMNSDSQQMPGANGLRGVMAGGDSGEQLFSVTAPEQAGVPVATGATGAGMTLPLTISLSHENTASAVDDGPGSTTSSLPGGAETKQEFDADGRVKVITYSGPGAEPIIESFLYQGGLLRLRTFPEGNSVSFDYFDDHPVLRSRGNLKTVTYSPGPRGVAGPPRIQASYLNYSPLYNFPIGDTKDLAGNTIKLTPTSDGRDIGLIDHNGDGQTERRYNSLGQIIFERDAQGVTRRYDYDESTTHFLKVVTEGPDDPESNLRTEFGYEKPEGPSSFNPGELGLPTRIIPPKAGTLPVLMDYDERGQLITTKRGAVRLERRSYDRNGNLARVATKVDERRDRIVRFRYAQNGFLLERTLLDVEVDGQGELPITTTFEPDALFRVQRITHPGNRIIEYEEFDHMGRPRRMKNGTYVEEYTYDRHGNILTVTRDGATDTLEYDGYDRVRSQSVAVGSGANPEITEFTYFPRNEYQTLLVKEGDGSVSLQQSWEVDALGRVKREVTKTDSGERVRLWGYLDLETTETEVATGEVQRRKTDRAGRVRELEDSTRTIVHKTDKNSNLEQLDSDEGILKFRFNYFHDDLDQMTSASDHIGLLIRQEFRADGLVERVFDALNQRTEIGLSVLGERLQITRPNLVEFHYGFDEGRRAVAARDKRGLGHAARYDAEFRLVESKLADGSATINSDFDARHQRPRRSVGSGVQADRTFDAQGRLLTRDLTFSGDLRRETFTYDALDRVRTATFPSGKWEYRYDLLGPMKSATLTVQGHDYVVGQTLRADGAVTRVSYPGPEPVTVDLGRDSAGRLRTVLPQGQTPVISSSSYVGAAHIGSLLIGGNTLLDQQTVFDSRGRTLGRRYVRLTDGAVVMDVRYLHDQVNNFTVRQEMHRAGRAEVFLCDAGSRLVGAHYGARAPVAEETGRPGYTPFDLPLAAPQTFKPGYFSRAYQYDLGGLDLLLRVSELNPDNIPSWPASREFGGHDDFLVPLVVDGTQRGRDSLGNVSRTRLLIWKPGASQPTNVFATLRYNGLNQLIRLDRDDGVSLDYSYDEKGLMFQRVLHDPQLPGGVRHTVLVWDGGRLLAEYDRTGGSNQLLARYYYFIGDVPVAMDRRDAGGELHRYYFLTDALGHVVALADAGAQLVTRYAYDVWGQFRPEAPDLTLPEVARVVATVDGFQLEFTETILPGGTAPEFPQLQADTRAFGDVAEVRLDGAPVGGAWRYVESVVGRPFGSVLQFASQSPLAGNVELQLRAGVAMDEWNNRNAAKIVSFTVAAGTPPGTVLSTPAPDDPGPTTVVQLSPFQFQGQYFDPDAGLIYMRARFYNPDSGSFLQRDPEAYTDSPNLYAALGHNPVSLRDPSGRMAKPGGPRPPRPPGPPPPKTNPKPAPPAPAPQANRTPGASKTPGQTSPATAQTGGASRRFPNVEAAVEAKVRTKLKESTEDHIQSVLRTLDKNQELEFVNYGAGWDVFRVHGTSRALRIARDDNYRVLDTGQIIPDTASGIMNEKGLHKFTQTVRGHVAYDAAGLMEFRGASLKGKVTLGKRHVEFGRPVIEMHFFENASDFTPSNQRPLTRLDDEHLRLAQEVERFDRDYGDFQTLRAEINGVERLVAVDPPELKHAQFMNGLRSLKNRGRISDDEFKTYADMPRAILDANR